ncbi:MAG: ankyrin repeat domain-containing protein [Pyrinomonadaceae bacterium]
MKNFQIKSLRLASYQYSLFLVIFSLAGVAFAQYPKPGVKPSPWEEWKYYEYCDVPESRVCVINSAIYHYDHAFLRKKIVDLDFEKVDKYPRVWSETPLIRAALSGDVEILRIVLERKPNLEIRDSEKGMTALMWISYWAPPYYLERDAYFPIAKELVAAGVDLEAKNEQGATVLLMSSEYGSEEFAEFYLEKGANIAARDKKGRTALMLAWDSVLMIEILMRFGAEIDARDNDGMTALSTAVKGCKLKKASSLLGFGAKPDIKDNEGKTAIDHAEAGAEKCPQISELLKGWKGKS